MLVWVWFQHDVVCKRNYAIFLLVVRLCTAGLMLVWVWFQRNVVCKRNYAFFLFVVCLCPAGPLSLSR